MRFQRLQRNTPGVLDRLAPVFHDDAADVVAITDRWKACLTRIRKTLDDADSRGPDTRIVELLTKDVANLSELVVEAETHYRLLDVCSKARWRLQGHFLSERASLKPLVDKLLQSPFPFQSSGGRTAISGQDSRRSLHSLSPMWSRTFLRNPTAISKADAEKRGKLGREIGLLSASQEKAYSDIEEDSAPDCSRRRHRHGL